MESQATVNELALQAQPVEATLPELALPEYVSPTELTLGALTLVTKGSSQSGTADANSQYYW